MGVCRLGMRSTLVSRISVPVALLAASLVAAGCGYSSDRSQIFRTTNSNDDRVRTVALDIFESREFRRGLELQLTEALAKEIESTTPFKLAKKDRADTAITGRIFEVRQGTIGRDFDLEYGSDRIEMHLGAVEAGQKVLLIDDLIATGGTAEAAVELLREVGAEVVECAFVIALPDLGGTRRLEKIGCKLHWLCEFAGD